MQLLRGSNEFPLRVPGFRLTVVGNSKQVSRSVFSRLLVDQCQIPILVWSELCVVEAQISASSPDNTRCRMIEGSVDQISASLPDNVTDPGVIESDVWQTVLHPACCENLTRAPLAVLEAVEIENAVVCGRQVRVARNNDERFGTVNRCSVVADAYQLSSYDRWSGPAVARAPAVFQRRWTLLGRH